MGRIEWPEKYQCRQGSGLDRALLLKFMRRTFQELTESEENDLAHLSDTVSRYLSEQTPIWLVEEKLAEAAAPVAGLPSSRLAVNYRAIACLWMGRAIAQESGDLHANIFLLYVDPQHRRQGLASRLLACGESWAKERGDRQIGLQVFVSNEAALRLYEQAGYQVHSYWMTKPL